MNKACRYDSELNPSYQQWAEHYGVVVLPARPRRPQDKAKMEVSVQIVEHWILARLRHCRFCSLAQLNASIKELLEELNRKPFKQMPGNRLDTFKRFEQPALRVLPRHPYQYVEIKRAKVNLDYHVSLWASLLLGTASVCGPDPGSAWRRKSRMDAIPGQ